MRECSSGWNEEKIAVRALGSVGPKDWILGSAVFRPIHLHLAMVLAISAATGWGGFTRSSPGQGNQRPQRNQ